MEKQSFGYRTIRMARIDSTNNFALKLIQKEDIANGTIIISDYQTEGRGQRMNHWVSDEGLNLTFSIVLFPRWLRPDAQFILSQLVCLGISDYLLHYTDEVKIKWPNDVYVGNRKICGILIESAIRGMHVENSIVGIGLNMNQMNFGEFAANAVSLAQITGQTFDLQEELSFLVKKIEERYWQAVQGDEARIRDEYFERLLYADEYKQYTDAGGTFIGKIENVYPDGRLQILKADGTRQLYVFKEIEFQIPSK